ncbi:hypothetical protein ACFE04_030834 [Oxalis oulophora]
MEEAIESARGKDTKARMAAVERLHQLLEASRKSLTSTETTSLVDCCLDLLKDNNYKVAQGALQVLASAAVLSGEHFKLHLNSLVPATVDRLGDGKQPVRDGARRLLLTLMEVSSPTLIVERAGSFAWTHKSWRIREEFARTVTSAISLFASTELPLQRAILPSILHMLNDSNPAVREAAISCIEEMYMQAGTQFRDELQRHNLPTYLVKDINARLERIEPRVNSSDGVTGSFPVIELKPSNYNPKKSSPKAKGSRETSVFKGAYPAAMASEFCINCVILGEGDISDKAIEPIKVYSEKELIREFEKIALTLVPEKDWSLRITAMQRLEALICGGAIDYPCFQGLLKQLVGPLTSQLLDRRSTIVKQACHLLCFLSKELLSDFETFAEQFIPVLFKLVVITVLIIAESADNCIKTMLLNCKAARVLPRIAECAKNDRNAVLRARCCEYALLILEHWPDAPEIQRSADLYADLIRCCVADAMSEVRSTARMCYRMFAKTWPERSNRLFSSFDTAIQRIINEEDGGGHRRFASSSMRDKSAPSSIHPQTSLPSNMPAYGTSAIVAMDRSSSLSTGRSISSGLLSQSKTLDKGSERSLESVLHASKQKVSAIESMLRRLEMSDRNSSSLRSSSLDLGVDTPSSRDPPFPAAVRASNHLSSSFPAESTTSSMNKASVRNGGLGLSDIISQIQASKDSGKLSYRSNSATESLPAFSSYSAKRVPYTHHTEEKDDFRQARRFVDRQYLDTAHRDVNPYNSHVPNFQRPLSRKNTGGRMSANRRSFDDSQLSLGELSNSVDGPASLNDALNEGLNPTSDWSARVSAFNYLQSLLQQGPKGVQEIIQSFEKVMKLFFQHLDDPHHKVAQAALSTLANIIPACRKPFESYMERILPHVFSRLIDPKELVRQSCSTTLEVVSKTYTTDSLLPALLRSLDEQRSPKAKLAVIEYAIGSFNKHALNSESSGNIGILKLWLGKLAPLVHDKNTKLKEASISCIIAVYSHFDPTTVLNFILSLSVEEQNSLRRCLKQKTPRIEVDLMNFLQSKKDRQRSKSSYDPYDAVGTSSEEGYASASKRNHLVGRYSAGSVDADGGRKWSASQETTLIMGGTDHTSDESKFEARSKNDVLSYMVVSTSQDVESESPTDNGVNLESLYASHFESNGINRGDLLEVSGNSRLDEEEATSDFDINHLKPATIKVNSIQESGPSIPQILHMYFNQILTAVLESLDDSDSLTRELTISLIAEMLKNQKCYMEESVEIVVEKLLHVTKDIVSKISSEAESCLAIVLSQYDPFRCLSVITPLLMTEDEKTLVTCINCLTKEELTAQLNSFLPALFEAFGNPSADVRKTVVFCLVDIYIMLGKEFLPHMEGLNSTQLRLVSIYANRISQARTGTSIDANH